MKTQTIRNGTRVTFMIKGDTTELLKISGLKISEIEFIRTYGNKSCIVKSLETFTELGVREFEYYNIVFDSGVKFIGISGYYLKDIPWKFNKG